MKEVWRIVRGYPNYRVSNYGRIKNKKTDRILKGTTRPNGRNYVGFNVNGKTYNKMRAKIVLLHFRKEELGKEYALHINNNLWDCTFKNLKWGTLGDVKRMFNTIKNKKRGVYKYNRKESRKKWRAVIKHEDKAKTIGYFHTEKEAEQAYINEYVRIYKHIPYVA